MKKLSSIESALSAIQRGEIVIVIDAEDRGTEGEFVCAAEAITPEIVNLMLAHGRGLLCCSILPDVAQRLDLSPITSTDPDYFGPEFTVTVDHDTVQSGITAQERCFTIRSLVDSESTPSDFSRPGHVQPLIAKEGGVLRRAGHTEASVDLAKMAGLIPAGVICGILNEDGERASHDELMEIADRHGLKIVTIEELIRFRRKSEKLVKQVANSELKTVHGDFRAIAYEVLYESQQPVAFTMGDLQAVDAPLVRLHSSCFTGDLVTSMRCDCGEQLHMALEMIGKEGVGALIYLPQEGRGIGLLEKIKAYNLQDQGMDTVEANLALGHKADLRDYGVGIQILKDLGLSKIRLMTNNPKKTDAFIYGGYDLEVVDQIAVIPPANVHNEKYMATKRDKMGHVLP